MGAGRLANGRLIRALVLSTLVGAQILVGALKVIVARPRPTEALEAAISFAYPSGHALRAAAVYGLAAWTWHRWSPPGWRSVGVVLIGLLLDVRLVDAQRPWSRLRMLWAVLTGRMQRAAPYARWTATRVDISIIEGPVPVAYDGEIMSSQSRLAVRKDPRSLVVMQPDVSTSD